MNNFRRFLLYAVLVFVSINLYTNWTHRNESQDKKIDPVVTLPAEMQVLSISKSNQLKKKNRYVKVSTPKIDVVIDKVGARIVKVILKEYAEEVGGNNFVHVLNNSESHPLIASSGFSGDSDLIFTSSRNQYVLSDKPTRITLSAMSSQGVLHEKSFVFHPSSYSIKSESMIVNRGSHPWTANFYTKLMAKKVKTFNDKEGLPDPSTFIAGENNALSSGMFTFNTFTGAAYYSGDKAYEKKTYKSIASDPLDLHVKDSWIAIQKRYFITAWAPSDSNEYNITGKWMSGVASDSKKESIQAFNYSMVGPKNVIQPGDKAQYSAVLYAGPEVAKNLIDLAPGLDKTIDYGFLWMISSFLFMVLEWIYRFIPSWGWSIIVLTFIIKLVFYKFSEASFRSLAKMKKINPRIQAIQENYKDDATAKNQAIMELYKKEKVNPLGGCLPLVLQIPFFIALYYVLIEAIQLRHAPFLWIVDLSAKDPYYILPVLMGASFFLQQRMSPAPQDPVQANMMMAMPVIFTALFSQFPAGLVLYWFMNNSFSILQQWLFLTRHPNGD